MKIRDATERDREAVSELYYELHPEEERERKEKGMLVPLRGSLKTVLLVAEEGGEVVGFIWGNLITYGFFRYGMIEELFVKKEFRNRGIGRSLVREILNRFKRLKAEVVLVTTDPENKKAADLYEKTGFKPCRGPWFFWTPEDRSVSGVP